MTLPPAIDVDARVEPEFRPVLERLARWDTTSIDTIRATYRQVAAPPVPADPRVRRTDAVIPGFEGRPDVRVRWYRPIDADPTNTDGMLPCLVYFHGGAYIMGSLDENDDRLDLLAIEHSCAVVSVDWRLAPEHPYPEGLDDAESVWRAIAADPAAHGIDPARMVLGGSSAGAGLAAALCLRLRDVGVPQPVLQLLVYPMLDDREEHASIRALEGGPGHWGLWQLRAQRLAWGAYHSALPAGEIPPTAAPGRATDLSGLAPAFLGIGDLDAYLDENLAYAARLSGSGVSVELHVYPGVIHGGFIARPSTPRTIQFLRDVSRALGRALGREVAGD